MPHIVLAAKSPRRPELLRRMGITDFSVVVPDVEETYPEGLAPQEIVAHIARLKSDAAAPLGGPEDILITADTMVFLENDRLGKPRDEADALRMLTELAGNRPTVCTGVTVRQGGKADAFTVSTDVTSVPARRRSCAPTSPPASRWTRRALTACRAWARCSSSASMATSTTSWDCRWRSWGNA